MKEGLFIEYTVVGLYLILMIIVGYAFRSRNQSSDDYFRAGARGTWWLVGSSALMSAISAGVFTGVGGSMFEAGIAPMASNLGILLGHIVLWLGVAALFRQARTITSPEMMRERFGPVTQQFYAYLNMMMMPVFGGFQVYALAIFTSAVFFVPIHITIIVVGTAVGIYSVTGGKWAVMATDFLQSLTMIPVVILVAVVSVIKLGGPVDVFNKISNSGGFQAIYPSGTYPDDYYTGGWFAMIALIAFVNQLQMGMGARFFSAKDGPEANKAAGFLLGMGTLLVFFMFFPPLIARAYFPDAVYDYEGILQKPAEAAYVVTCLKLMPSGILGLVLVAMFAATASSMDTGLNTNSGDITRNILPPIRAKLGHPPLTLREELRVGRLVSIVLVIVIISIALWMAGQKGKGVFELVMSFGARITLPMTLPFTLAIFIRSLPRSAAIVGISFGLIFPFLLNPLIDSLFNELNAQYGSNLARNFATTAQIVLFSSLSGILFSYRIRQHLESASDLETTNDFYLKMHTPVDFEKEIGKADDHSQMHLIGKLALVAAGLLSLLLLFPNPLLGRLSILAVSLSIGTVGGLMTYFGSKGEKKLPSE